MNERSHARLMMMTKKVAIVTGANRGIGREVALGLAEDGYHIVLIARKKESLIELQHEISEFGGQSELIICDITQFESLTEQLNHVLKKHGRCDVLVNNAGIFINGTLDA